MGGIGSGGWRVRSKWRMVLEDLPKLDIANWSRAGVLVPGSLFDQPMSAGDEACGNVGVVVASDAMVHVLYTRADDPDHLVRVDIELIWTSCRLGGRRPWFVCPDCRCRCSKLYLLKRLRCRRCCHLPYRSQTLTLAERVVHRAERLRLRLADRKQALARRRGKAASDLDHLEAEIAQLERRGRLLSLQAFLGSAGGV